VKVIYWGTPEYSIPTLTAIHNEGHEILAVVTQPDKKRSRGGKLSPSPVKNKAIEMNIDVFTTCKISDDERLKNILADLKADIYIVVAFGQLLPKSILDQPPLGCWNGHGSLLPRWRGAGPIQWSILKGDLTTGVNIMHMEEGLDTGPILLEEVVNLGINENAGELSKRLSNLTALNMVRAISMISRVNGGTIDKAISQLNPKKQASIKREITYARQIKKTDYLLNWQDTSIELHRKVLALFPNAYVIYNGKRLKIQKTEPLAEEIIESLSHDAIRLINTFSLDQSLPGEVLLVKKNIGIVVRTINGSILIKQAQLEGRNIASGNSLIQQLKIEKGGMIY